MSENDLDDHDRAPDEGSAQDIEIPDEIALLPLLNLVVYPTVVAPLAVGQALAVRLIDDAMRDQHLVALVTLRDEERRPARPSAADMYEFGTVALIHRLLRLPDGTLRIAAQGIERVRIDAITKTEPYLRARISVIAEACDDDREAATLVRSVQQLAAQMLQLLPAPGEDLYAQIASESDPRQLAYLVASTLLFRSNAAERQALLELPTVREKLARLTTLLRRDLNVLRGSQGHQAQVQPPIQHDTDDQRSAADTAPAAGETDLATLLHTMQPTLHAAPYVFCSVDAALATRFGTLALGVFREAEGVTLILTQAQAHEAGLAAATLWACITLTVHSSLAAIGLIAAVATKLAAHGIGVNPVAGYYHDHLFVPWNRRDDALRLLDEFQRR